MADLWIHGMPFEITCALQGREIGEFPEKRLNSRIHVGLLNRLSGGQVPRLVLCTPTRFVGSIKKEPSPPIAFQPLAFRSPHYRRGFHLLFSRTGAMNVTTANSLRHRRTQ